MKLDKYTVGKRYGKALFELAVEKNQAEAIYQELLTLREVYHQVPGIGDILSDDRLEPYEKDSIMEKLVTGFSEMMQNFLRVVYEYRRMYDLLLMIDEYERRYDERPRTNFGFSDNSHSFIKRTTSSNGRKSCPIIRV